MLPLACALLGMCWAYIFGAASCTRGPRLSLLPFNACLAVSKHPASNLQPIFGPQAAFASVLHAASRIMDTRGARPKYTTEGGDEL